MNQAFLDEQIKAGKAFVLETSLDDAIEAFAKGQGADFLREVQYILSKGYTLSDDGMKLIPGVNP